MEGHSPVLALDPKCHSAGCAEPVVSVSPGNLLKTINDPGPHPEAQFSGSQQSQRICIGDSGLHPALGAPPHLPRCPPCWEAHLGMSPSRGKQQVSPLQLRRNARGPGLKEFLLSSRAEKKAAPLSQPRNPCISSTQGKCPQHLITSRRASVFCALLF